MQLTRSHVLFALPRFTAVLIEIESGQVYGACFHLVTKRNGRHAAHEYRASDCRKRCREFGADLPVPRTAEIQKYMMKAFILPNMDKATWLGAKYSLEAGGKYLWLPDGSEVNFTSYPSWFPGQPNGNSLFECGQSCVEIRSSAWYDIGCDLKRSCLCHVENATRDGATVYVYDDNKKKVEEQKPFFHKPESLALVLASLAVLGLNYYAAAYGGTASTRVDPQDHTVGMKISETIEHEEEAELEKFKDRLDDTAIVPRFHHKEEEHLFAKTVADAGVKGIQTTLMRTLPAIMLAASTAELALIEGLNSIPGIGEPLSEREFGSRPQVSSTMIHVTSYLETREAQGPSSYSTTCRSSRWWVQLSLPPAPATLRDVGG